MTVAGMGTSYETGVEAVTSKIMHISSRAIPAEAKHRSRLHFHLAQQQAIGKWALLTDGQAWLEAPGANLCSVYDDTLFFHTRNALPGITMATVREMAQRKKWRVRESDDWMSDPKRLDELWLMGTPFCLLAVKSVDGVMIGNGRPGPRYIEMIHDWSIMTGVDIPRQIARWDAELEMVHR
jgi:branched-subunit amino acid aminotransferase/4-amino-4-deoxychorismate lyase